jgi:hypothetical protein
MLRGTMNLRRVVDTHSIRKGCFMFCVEPRGWRNVDFGYTVTLQIRAPSAYPPPPTTPQKRQFSDFLCQKHTQSGNTLHFLNF